MAKEEPKKILYSIVLPNESWRFEAILAEAEREYENI